MKVQSQILEAGILLAVPLERPRAGVPLEAVELDDDAGVAPEEVDIEDTDLSVSLGVRQAGVADQLKQPLLRGFTRDPRARLGSTSLASSGAPRRPGLRVSSSRSFVGLIRRRASASSSARSIARAG